MHKILYDIICSHHLPPSRTQVNHTHATACYDCPAGYYCELAGQSIPCPAGYFCPAGTGLDWQACPRGTYSSVTGLYDQSQCLPCPAGKYCGGEHLTTETGERFCSRCYMDEWVSVLCFIIFPQTFQRLKSRQTLH